MQTINHYQKAFNGSPTSRGTLHSKNSTNSDTSSFKLGSLDNQEDLDEAVEIIKSGGVVISQFRSLFGIWVRADDLKAVENAVFGIKNRSEKRPMAAMMGTHAFLALVNPDAVHPSLKHLVQNPDDFQRRLGAICIVGAPIAPEIAKDIPETLLSQSSSGQYKMLNLDPSGNPFMAAFMEKLKDSGVRYVGVSSLNIHSQKEIHDLKKAISFVESKPNLRLILKDPLASNRGVKGSFPIIDIETATAIRDGHIPIWLIEKAIGSELDKSNMKQPNYKQHRDFEDAKERDEAHPHAWRTLALHLTEK